MLPKPLLPKKGILHHAALPFFFRRMVGLKDANAAKKMLQEMAVSVLNEIKDLPSAVTDPNWLAKVEEDGGQ